MLFCWLLLFLVDSFCFFLVIAVSCWFLLFLVGSSPFLMVLTVSFWFLLFLVGSSLFLMVLTVSFWFLLFLVGSSVSCWLLLLLFLAVSLLVLSVNYCCSSSCQFLSNIAGFFVIIFIIWYLKVSLFLGRMQNRILLIWDKQSFMHSRLTVKTSKE